MNEKLTYQNVAKSTNSTFVPRSLQGLALTPTVLYLLWYIKLKETQIRHQRANVTVEKRTNGISESCLIPEALQGKNCLRTPNNLKGEITYARTHTHTHTHTHTNTQFYIQCICALGLKLNFECFLRI